MFCTHTMPRSNDAALKQGKRRFNGVRMQITNGVKSLAVIDRLVLAEHARLPNRLRIRGKVIGHHHVNILRYVFLDVLRQGAGLHVGSMEKSKFTAALTDADDNLFRSATSPLAAPLRFSADIGLVNFHRATER